MHRTIEVIVAPSGEVTIEAVGFQGNACEKATEAIEKALGMTSSRTKKPEYFAMNTTGTRQTTRNG
jgi:hypothetical protein